ncbi:hypothetical protein BU24DRAFT_241849 [Aaosphaeria arxii CBS 175.79]|uniref:Uncharacterized protein n=1 Tax=Aaosphaeria arxii CBS 175.79 TaxID=1450172 RepID=A0A6A5XK44_9PLEO|nr:uncharacterized protein BU24DRAFT_241849 [Aaosphaeria arxii CBS 175.79]KAF2013625.1 hypothetical protein BU24DRAFT_241849 [Aaosphaeria arxii CBS 175.79]
MSIISSALSNGYIVSTILEHLSNMKYKVRRQQAPELPVELLEFRPTLIPSILVNQLWADEGISILWKRYPYLPALHLIEPTRRQYYASKIQHLFYRSLISEKQETTLDFLNTLNWSNLKTLELEIDLSADRAQFSALLHPSLEHLELSGTQSGTSSELASSVLPSLFSSLQQITGVRFGAGFISEEHPVHASVLNDILDSLPSISTVEVKSSRFVALDELFSLLTRRPGLEGLEIDLEPGLTLLPLFSGPNAVPSPFQDLRRLNIMCYPEIALAILPHLALLEDLQLDICRDPTLEAHQADSTVVEEILAKVSRLSRLKIGVGTLSMDFPSDSSFPLLCGTTLRELAKRCPDLVKLNLFALDPSYIDGSNISSEEFDSFCQLAPQLHHFTLKLHPGTASTLEDTALQSLSKHCPELEVIRLSIPLKLPSLPASGQLPQILISEPGTPATDNNNQGDTTPQTPTGSTSSAYFSFNEIVDYPEGSNPQPLFPTLTHLALARPESVLSSAEDEYTPPRDSHPSILAAELQENLVRSWAQPLLTHFPRLEILEVWGDWTGTEIESLNYFLPTQELLATTWEFLSGVEQDLWANGEEEEEYEGDEWRAYNSGDDWDAAASLNEMVLDDATITNVDYDAEPEGCVTPVRTVEGDGYFDERVVQSGSAA